jgi:hypothetical protein
MIKNRLRYVGYAVPILMLLWGILDTRWERYQIDGDANAFMDIADLIHAHRFADAANGYWNPAYSAALALGQAIAHPSRFGELQVFYWVNFAIFLGCIAACLFFVQSLVRLRALLSQASDSAPALSPLALRLSALALLFYSFQRELALSAVRSDALLLFFFLLAGGLVFRLQAGARLYCYGLLGLSLGLAYLTKSFAFLPSIAMLFGLFLFGITRRSNQAAQVSSRAICSSSPQLTRNRILGGTLLAAVVFVGCAAPYIAAISHQRGRLTTGESARLNYAFFIDGMARWHEFRTNEIGHAKVDWKHHETLLLNDPPVYSYAVHPVGTYPLWFDPAWYTDTVHPVVYLPGQVHQLVRNTALLVRFFAGHAEVFVLLFALLLTGSMFVWRANVWLPMLPILALGILFFLIYYPVDFQDRYLTAALLLTFLPLLAVVRRPHNGPAGEIALGLALLLVCLSVTTAFSDVLDRRRVMKVYRQTGAFNTQYLDAAHSMAALGIRPGENVACFGTELCQFDTYWARLAGTPIRAEIQVPGDTDAGAYWNSLPDQKRVVDTLRKENLAAIVAHFAPSSHIPADWHQLGKSDLYAYLLGPGQSPG